MKAFDAPTDDALMERAIENAEKVRGSTAPNPWVGAVILSADGEFFDGATEPPGGSHAERVAIDLAGTKARGATLYTTLEPCSHHGRTPPCVSHILESGVERVVTGVTDPDPHVSGAGIDALKAAGVEVVEGVKESQVRNQLEAYMHHRTTGKPWVVLKMAMTIDGRTAAADGSSEWITSQEARQDVHALRARCDSVMGGAGTVRSDDPSLTTRFVSGSDPRRIVLGKAPEGALIHPCWELDGDLVDVLFELGSRGVVDLLVEGGATLAASMHQQGLVNEYIFYLAPALMGGDDGHPVFMGPGSATMSGLWRGDLRDVRKVGSDLRIEFRPLEGD